MGDSKIATNSGPGEVDSKQIKELAKQWGRLPPQEREQQLQRLTQSMPIRYAEIVREYFRKLTEQGEGNK